METPLSASIDFRCAKCNETFKSQTLLHTHRTVFHELFVAHEGVLHKRQEDGLFRCPKCAPHVAFASSQDFTKHLSSKYHSKGARPPTPTRRRGFVRQSNSDLQFLESCPEVAFHRQLRVLMCMLCGVCLPLARGAVHFRGVHRESYSLWCAVRQEAARLGVLDKPLQAHGPQHFPVEGLELKGGVECTTCGDLFACRRAVHNHARKEHLGDMATMQSCMVQTYLAGRNLCYFKVLCPPPETVDSHDRNDKNDREDGRGAKQQAEKTPGRGSATGFIAVATATGRPQHQVPSKIVESEGHAVRTGKKKRSDQGASSAQPSPKGKRRRALASDPQQSQVGPPDPQGSQKSAWSPSVSKGFVRAEGSELQFLRCYGGVAFHRRLRFVACMQCGYALRKCYLPVHLRRTHDVSEEVSRAAGWEVGRLGVDEGMLGPLPTQKHPVEGLELKKGLECTVCGALFALEGIARLHVRVAHPGRSMRMEPCEVQTIMAQRYARYFKVNDCTAAIQEATAENAEAAEAVEGSPVAEMGLDGGGEGQEQVTRPPQETSSVDGAPHTRQVVIRSRLPGEGTSWDSTFQGKWGKHVGKPHSAISLRATLSRFLARVQSFDPPSAGLSLADAGALGEVHGAAWRERGLAPAAAMRSADETRPGGGRRGSALASFLSPEQGMAALATLQTEAPTATDVLVVLPPYGGKSTIYLLLAMTKSIDDIILVVVPNAFAAEATCDQCLRAGFVCGQWTPPESEASSPDAGSTASAVKSPSGQYLRRSPVLTPAGTDRARANFQDVATLVVVDLPSISSPFFDVFYDSIKPCLHQVVVEDFHALDAYPELRPKFSHLSKLVRHTRVSLVLLCSWLSAYTQSEVAGRPRVLRVQQSVILPQIEYRVLLVEEDAEMDRFIRRKARDFLATAEDDERMAILTMSDEEALSLSERLRSSPFIGDAVACVTLEGSMRERYAVLEEWKRGKRLVLVGPSAVSFGLRYHNLSTVIHRGSSPSLVAFAHGCGRAGQNGRKASCWLVSSSAYLRGRERRSTQENQVVRWARDEQKCRRQQLHVAVNEVVTGHCFVNDRCQPCDVCMASVGIKPSLGT